MKPIAIRPWLSRTMLSSVASNGLGLMPCVTGTFAPIEGPGSPAEAQAGLVPLGTQPMSPESGASGPGSAMHWPRIGRQYFCGRPTSVHRERYAPPSAQSSQPVQGPVAQDPPAQTEPVMQSLLTEHCPQKPHPLGLSLGTVGSLTGPPSVAGPPSWPPPVTPLQSPVDG